MAFLVNSNKHAEWVIEKCLFLSAISAIFFIVLIIVFIFEKGLPMIIDYGLLNFILGTNWFPLDGQFGIFPMILGTLYVTAGAMVLGVPLGLACAIFLAETAPEKMKNSMEPVIESLAGIPSIVYGFFGIVVIVPFMRDAFGAGFSILTCSIILAIMVLPTIISISQDAISSVPKEYKEASIALGATHWQTIKKIILPNAMPGIATGVLLGVGRAIGETMAVLMVSGNVVKIPSSIFDPVRPLTANIALEMNYAYGIHREALFATGVILLVVTFALIMVVDYFQRGN